MALRVISLGVGSLLGKPVTLTLAHGGSSITFNDILISGPQRLFYQAHLF